jgi:hypothetical protein
VIYGGVPTHPHPGRVWEIVEKYQVGGGGRKVVWERGGGKGATPCSQAAAQRQGRDLVCLVMVSTTACSFALLLVLEQLGIGWEVVEK